MNADGHKYIFPAFIRVHLRKCRDLVFLRNTLWVKRMLLAVDRSVGTHGANCLYIELHETFQWNVYQTHHIILPIRFPYRTSCGQVIYYSYTVPVNLSAVLIAETYLKLSRLICQR